MKKLLFIAILSLSGSLFANYRCTVSEICAPTIAPFTVKVDKGFIEFPEITGDRAILSQENIEDSVVFNFEGGTLQIIHDTSFDTPFGGYLTLKEGADGAEYDVVYDVACKIIR